MNECIPSAELRVAKLTSLCPAPLHSRLLREATQDKSQRRWALQGCRDAPGCLGSCQRPQPQPHPSSSWYQLPARVVVIVLASPEPARCVLLENRHQLACARPQQDPPRPHTLPRASDSAAPQPLLPLPGPWAASPPAAQVRSLMFLSPLTPVKPVPHIDSSSVQILNVDLDWCSHHKPGSIGTQ